MGTTRDAIRGSNPELAFVLCIEGYKYLLTDGLPSDATTAWAGTLWSDALTGLRVIGDLEQSIKPWSNEPSVQSLTFSVVGDSDTDQFAVDVFRQKPTNRSELTVGFDTADSDGGGFDITVKEADQFASASHVYIGNEAFEVTGTPAGFVIGVATNGEGVFAPFSGNTGSTNRFPAPHSIAGDFENVNNFDANAPVYVSDAPTNWIGKKVGLWVHRVSGGVWDTKEESELWFAGVITSVAEGEMSTDLECSSIVQSIMDAELIPDQWTGRLKEGYVFDGTEEFQCWYSSEDVGSPVWEPQFSATFTTTGRLSATELASELTDFFDADSEVGNDSSADLRWEFSVIDADNGPRFEVRASRDGVTSTRRGHITFRCNNRDVWKFLGWDEPTPAESGWWKAGTGTVEDYQWAVYSGDAPYRYPTLGTINSGSFLSNGTTELVIEDSDGTFFDQTAYLPAQVQALVNGDTWGLFSLGGSVLFIGRYVSATSITGITLGIGLPGITLTPGESMSGLRIGDGRSLSVKQCLFLTGSFSDLIAKLFASVDGNGVNHATYDVFPFGGSVPWDLLGEDFITSLQEVEQSTSEDSISLIVEKPMRLWDVLKSDFALRMSAPIWKDGGIQIAQLAVPNASTADHTLDETNKGDARRTVPRQTSEFQVHTLKIEYNRSPLKEEYKDTHIVRDQLGYQQHGKAGKTKTIRARNSYAGVVETGSSVEALGDMLASRFMPVLSRPLKTWERSINHQLFHMAPGDTATLSDDRVRNPLTGERGISSRACTVLSVSHSLGISSGGGQGYHGNVELLYTEEDRAFNLAPSAEMALAASGSGFTAGYDSTNDRVAVHQHYFSDATEDNDSAAFTVGDAIHLIEADPADPTAPSTHTDTIAAIVEGTPAGYDYIELTTGFTPTASTIYRVEFDSYDQCSANQLLYAFQADDVDGEILDTIEPNILGDSKRRIQIADATGTDLPERYSDEQYGDGVPFSAGFVKAQANMLNNLQQYKTAPHMPAYDDGGGYAPGGIAGTYYCAWIFPWLVGPPAGRELKRALNVAAQFASTTGAATYVRVSSCSSAPQREAEPSLGLPVVNFGTIRKNQITFTTSTSSAIPNAYPILAAQELAVIRDQANPGITWIAVEIDGIGDLQAIPELWLGPAQ